MFLLTFADALGGLRYVLRSSTTERPTLCVAYSCSRSPRQRTWRTLVLPWHSDKSLDCIPPGRGRRSTHLSRDAPIPPQLLGAGSSFEDSLSGLHRDTGTAAVDLSRDVHVCVTSAKLGLSVIKLNKIENDFTSLSGCLFQY